VSGAGGNSLAVVPHAYYPLRAFPSGADMDFGDNARLHLFQGVTEIRQCQLCLSMSMADHSFSGTALNGKN
jgi:hypothetical protein